MKKHTFETELLEGHKGVLALVVPFDPERAFGEKPVRLAGRRHGWLVKGTLEGVGFEGYVGERWGRFFVQIPDALRKRAKAAVGDVVAVTLEAADSDRAFEIAFELSKETTQPKTPRKDARIRAT